MTTTPATTATHGPVRKVTGTEPWFDAFMREHERETLECGHKGEIVRYGVVGKRRRCWDCLTPEQKAQAGSLLGWG